MASPHAAIKRLPRFRLPPSVVYPRFTVNDEDAATRPPSRDERLTTNDVELAGNQVPQPTPAYPTFSDAPVDGTRKRVVSSPNEAAYENPGDQSARYLDALMNEEVTDRNGRSGSFMAGLGEPIKVNDSLGNMIGQRLGNAISNAIDPDRDEEIAHDAEVKRATARDKQQRERDEAAADVEYKKAQAAAQRHLPVWRDEEQRRKEAESGRRLDQLERRLDDQARYNDARVEQGERRQNETERSNKAKEEDRDADRTSREKIAQWQTASRKEVAQIYASIGAERNAIQAERNTVLKQQQEQEFNAKYPGYGKPALSKDYIINKAKALRMLPEDVAKQAIQQGYQIEQ